MNTITLSPVGAGSDVKITVDERGENLAAVLQRALQGEEFRLSEISVALFPGDGRHEPVTLTGEDEIAEAEVRPGDRVRPTRDASAG